MRRPTLPTTLLLTAAGVSLAWAAAKEPPKPEPRVPVHSDAKDMEPAMLDAMRGFLHGDRAVVRAGFDRVENACRRMTHDEDAIWSRDMVNQDLAMHLALDRARETASRGDLDTSFDSMEWILRTCRDCHKLRGK